jgi:hypothetical protein
MTHDWTDFARRAATLFQESIGGDALVTSCERLVTRENATGYKKIVTPQWLDGSVTNVTGVTSNFDDSGAYPDEWRAILERLLRDDPPAWTSSSWWSEVGMDAATFLCKWGSTSHELGWTTLNLFGVHPAAPLVRFDAMGLIPMLRGRAVTTLSQDGAVIRGRSGANLVYLRKPDSQAVLITECQAHENS